MWARAVFYCEMCPRKLGHAQFQKRDYTAVRYYQTLTDTHNWTFSDIIGHNETLLDIIRHDRTLSDKIGHNGTLSDKIGHNEILMDNIEHCRTYSDIIGCDQT